MKKEYPFIDWTIDDSNQNELILSFWNNFIDSKIHYFLKNQKLENNCKILVQSLKEYFKKYKFLPICPRRNWILSNESEENKKINQKLDTFFYQNFEHFWEKINSEEKSCFFEQEQVFYYINNIHKWSLFEFQINDFEKICYQKFQVRDFLGLIKDETDESKYQTKRSDIVLIAGMISNETIKIVTRINFPNTAISLINLEDFVFESIDFDKN